MHFLVTHSTVLVTRKFCGAVSFRLYDYNKQRWYNWTVSQGLPKTAIFFQKLPKTAKNGQRLPEIAENCQIVIRKFRGAVSFHLNDTIGPLSKTCSKFPQISSKFPKIVKTLREFLSKFWIMVQLYRFWSHTVQLQ